MSKGAIRISGWKISGDLTMEGKANAAARCGNGEERHKERKRK